MHVHVRIDEFNQLGEWLLYTLKSRDLGELCKNFKIEAEEGKILQKNEEELLYKILTVQE